MHNHNDDNTTDPPTRRARTDAGNSTCPQSATAVPEYAMERAFSISITLTDQPPPLDQLSNKKACSFGGPPRGSANVYAYCACFFSPVYV